MCSKGKTDKGDITQCRTQGTKAFNFDMPDAFHGNMLENKNMLSLEVELFWRYP